MQNFLESSDLRDKFSVKQLQFAANFIDINNEELNADHIDILARMQ